MQITKIISSATVERLKQKARKLKREQSITHTEALDEIAISVGFNHWHQVVQANDVLKPSEVALSSGCVMAFDVKDGMDVDTSDGVLIEDHFLEMLTEKQLFEIYANSPDEDDEQKQTAKRKRYRIQSFRSTFERLLLIHVLPSCRASCKQTVKRSIGSYTTVLVLDAAIYLASRSPY